MRNVRCGFRCCIRHSDGVALFVLVGGGGRFFLASWAKCDITSFVLSRNSYPTGHFSLYFPVASDSIRSTTTRRILLGIPDLFELRLLRPGGGKDSNYWVEPLPVDFFPAG